MRNEVAENNIERPVTIYAASVHFRMWRTAVRVSTMQIKCRLLIKRWDVEQRRHGQSAKQKRNIAPFTVRLASLVAPLVLRKGSMTNVLVKETVLYGALFQICSL